MIQTIIGHASPAAKGQSSQIRRARNEVDLATHAAQTVGLSSLKAPYRAPNVVHRFVIAIEGVRDRYSSMH